MAVGSMNLRYRNFHPRDITACLRLLERYPEYTPWVFTNLPIFWKRLFDQQAMIAAVIEQYEPGAPATIVGFGADVFVTDAFIAEARAAYEPRLADRLVRRELNEKATPILRRNGIARANADAGLNVIIIHPGTPNSPQAIRFNMREAFIWAHRGFQIKEILQEVWDETDREWVQVWGALRGDYSDFYYRNGTPIPRYRPYLFGITREEALKDPGSLAAPLFLYTPPRFQFSQGAQELLTGAMDGETDIALAEKLRISLPAVKMRWRVIYGRVESVAPELFPTRTSHISESSRGKEKRRCIVEYVRKHPEELCPFSVSQHRTPAFH
jgi:hypothetical protein